jgi:hypothetical protein
VDYNFQLGLAKKDGPKAVEDYKHHLGIVESPIPYLRFRLRLAPLNHHLAVDPKGKDRWLAAFWVIKEH